jgi:hypothetical protein
MKEAIKISELKTNLETNVNLNYDEHIEKINNLLLEDSQSHGPRQTITYEINYKDEYICDSVTNFLSEYYEKEGYSIEIEYNSKYRLGNKLHISYS